MHMEQTIQTAKKPETSPKDFFLHLLSIVSLYASAISFSTLLFQLINSWFPDALGGYYSNPFSISAMRWAVAMLVVFFPTYIVTNIFLSKEYRDTPEKKDLRVRKWLLYFTLFVAALIILGDFVALLLNFMQGELTMRFFLKVLTIFFVAGSIFAYYLWELRNAGFNGKIKAFIYTVSCVVFVAVVAGFFVAGSPSTERARRFDSERISHLQTLQSEIVNYWQRKEALPENLEALRDTIKGFTPPTDPKTKMPYFYEVRGPESFVLCATFETVSSVNTERSYPYGGWGANWDHKQGEECFERFIDRDLYPPISTQKKAVPEF